VWNRILDKHGLLLAFEKKHGHKNPNSTDVHSVRQVENLAAYLAKYLSKNSDDENKIQGKIWGSSYSLSANNKCTLHGLNYDEIRADTAGIKNKSAWRPLERIHKTSGEKYIFGMMLRLTLSDWKTKVGGMLRRAFDDHCFSIRHDTEQIPFSYAS
jgi:hypothetical protein